MVLHDPGEDELYGVNHEVLEPVKPQLLTETKTTSASPPPPEAVSNTKPAELGSIGPGQDILIENLSGTSAYLRHDTDSVLPSPVDCSGGRFAMTDHADVILEQPSTGGVAERPGDVASLINAQTMVSSLIRTAADANAALEQERSTQAEKTIPALSQLRSDSAQDNVAQVQPEARPEEHSTALLSNPPKSNDQEDTIATSPTLRMHVITNPESNIETLPALQPTSPANYGSASSPQTAKLPPISQITGQRHGQLNELAEIATQHPRLSHHHSRSTGSTNATSPMTPYHPYSTNVQASPSSYHSARSPTSPASDYRPHYGSPTQDPFPAYYAGRRRQPSITDGDTPIIPQLPPPLPSASSSGESQSGHTSSSTDGYSTAHTTPTDLPPSADNTPRPIAPPITTIPSAVMTNASVYPCDFHGCKAPPFQTQYLLSSHRNVHSEDRTHFCPIKGCARSVDGLSGNGGKGFKRKNEMIRHRLVHESPGFICPYCPDREHKYPRPDNLQRHVRAHHKNKDPDDPLLLEVLAQGSAKTRRRRTNTGGSGSRI